MLACKLSMNILQWDFLLIQPVLLKNTSGWLVLIIKCCDRVRSQFGAVEYMNYIHFPSVNVNYICEIAEEGDTFVKIIHSDFVITS